MANLPPFLMQNGSGKGTVSNNTPVGGAGQPTGKGGKMDSRKAAIARRIRKNQANGKKP